LAEPASTKSGSTSMSHSTPWSSLGLHAAHSTDLIPRIEKGFSFTALTHFVSASGLSIPYTAGVIGIPERTLARRKKENRLSPEESERLLRISRLFEDSLRLFDGDRDSAVNWLRTPKKALRNRSPLQFARTEIGAREVENLIGRIQHGVFS
jgi:putative toxin-antitoxin system antitoxin component (TIGR02293 family)